MRAIAILAVTWLGMSTAAAQVEVKNDGFMAGAQVGYQSGFCINEVAASRFVAPAAGRQLLKVHFLFGAATDTKTITVIVWDDTAGTTTPGTELYRADYQVTGSANGIVESDLTSNNITVPQQFRVGILMQHMGQPSVARDSDGTIAADKNYILADAGCNAGGPYTWYRSNLLGLMGDWVIRADISAGGNGGSPDAGVGDAGIDAPAGSGDPCTSNAQCALGEFCDLDQGTCTFECRTRDDCGGGTCNSLGQCIAASGGDGGGCGCQANAPDAAATGGCVLLGFALLARRRRR